MSRRVAWLAAALVLSSCHRHAKPETSPPATSIETTPSSGSPPERAASPANGGPVTIEIEDGDAIANSLRSQIEDAEIERARLVYGALGLLDVDADLHSLFA
ncbi:MAG: hypothetical protein JRF42_06030, partial [Deltaproteobacteria bacterium]|nr:hypothetical protein [Deltaproteobacteria bacterium]